MEVITAPEAVQRRCLALRAAKRRIGLVPTMGFLHEGHLALIRAARAAADATVVSLFVNPTQFGPGEDFECYPRDPDRDLALCREAGVDVVFQPRSGDLYAPDHSVYVEETRLSRGLCGASRPGHFRGVLTIVTKLFHLTVPDVAVFGRKDAQQARLVRQLVRDLDMPVRILVAPIVREPDGLALSSRNRYLSRTERAWAPSICRALREAQSRWAAGVRDAEELRAGVTAALSGGPGADIEYVAIVDEETFEPVARIARPAMLAVAVKLPSARLIDNVTLGG